MELNNKDNELKNEELLNKNVKTFKLGKWTYKKEQFDEATFNNDIESLTMDNEAVRDFVTNHVVFTTLEKAIDFCRSNSLWPVSFGLACCAIEMMASGGARYDISRFGYEVFRASPRQADVMIVAGTITEKMAPLLMRLYEQMPEPKYVMAMGSCAISGGPFADSYNVVRGVDELIPVDVVIPGCPPRPEALIEGFLKLKAKLNKPEIAKVRKNV